jgi:glycine oxidase
VDCIIVGGGIIGCSIAWELARAGRRAAIFEASRPGSQASGAAAGMLAPGGEFDASSSLARDAVDSLRIYPAFVRDLSVESGTEIDFRLCGALEHPCGDAQTLARRANEQRNSLGIATQIRADGGVFYPDDALVDPRHAMQSLIAACNARGVQIFEQKPVRHVELSPNGVVVDETGARTAVIAAGAWSSSIQTVEILPESFPVRGHLLGYWLEPGLLPHILRRGPTYVFQRTNGYVIAGSDMEHVGFEAGPDPDRVEAIRRGACELFPALAGRRPDDVWTGFRPATAAGKPHICRFKKSRLWLAYGHFRNGILLAPHTARRIASEIIASLESD